MNISQSIYHKVTVCWWILKITYGLLFVVAGADKFTNIIVHWQKYLSPLFSQTGIDPTFFMYGVGIIEICIGLLTLSRWTKEGSWLVIIWFALIVLNLLSMGTFFDIAVRDTVMAIGAFVLVRLTRIRNEMLGLVETKSGCC